MKTKSILKTIGLCLLVAPVVAQASLLTIAPGGTTTVLSTVSGTWASAPSVVAGGYNVFAPPGEEVWYGDSRYSLFGNGNWNDFAWVGGYCFSGSCTATFDLGGLASAVGGFMNYAPGSGGTPMISALAADGVTILESYDLAAVAPIVTPGGLNAGEFRGIFRSEGDIAYLQISGSYLIMHDLTVSAVPEPETYAMLLAGLGILGFAVRRRRQVS
ncbi:MAG: hypothetical protein A4S08_12075 [Proteobacteria bacterium SG_bin4]|nr:MAG: hypothetical protein A4S08_12075 [Proteobacteria bacterium SG_bin4]